MASSDKKVLAFEEVSQHKKTKDCWLIISSKDKHGLTCSPHALFVEMDPWVISNVLQPNLKHTGFADVSVIHTARVENFLERADKLVGKDGAFDYISVTPPYMEVDYEVLMDQIS